jgi:hypothetical protein
MCQVETGKEMTWRPIENIIGNNLKDILRLPSGI